MPGYIYSVVLSVIIVSYNVKDLLEQCLHSVANAMEGIAGEVFVVDNNSPDNTAVLLQPLFPAVRFICNTNNVGFGKANNQGLALATGRYVLFLNPDTQVQPDCFARCLQFMNGHADAGALGVRMVNSDGIFLPESRRSFPTPAVSFWKLTGLAALFPRSRVFARYYAGHLPENRTAPVDVLSGAFMLVRKSVLARTGGFDEQFFMYAEDIDLSHRIKLAGYNNYYFPEVTILHHKGASTRKDFAYVRQFYKAMSQFVRKYYGRGVYAALLDTAITLRGAAEAVRLMMTKK